jgi:hypothetical protein
MSTHVSRKASSPDIVVNLLSGQLAEGPPFPDWQPHRLLLLLFGLELLAVWVINRERGRAPGRRVGKKSLRGA